LKLCEALAGTRVLFATTKGYIGSGPLDMRAGDKAILLSGFKALMILRPVKSCYEVIGRAYIHGIMNGEEWSIGEGMLTKFVMV
jgi:hypothetical protein